MRRPHRPTRSVRAPSLAAPLARPTARALARAAAGVLACLPLAGHARAAPAPTPAPTNGPSAQPGEPFMRVAEHEGGMRLDLEMAIRAYRPTSGDGPTVYLAGAVHMGEPEFYHRLQLFLDAQDVVLYEGVQPTGTPRDSRWNAPRDDELKAEIARARARLLASRLARRFGPDQPGSLAALREATPEPQLAFLDPLLIDPFGHAYATAAPEIDTPDADQPTPLPVVIGLGADGEIGGEGPSADVYASPRYLPRPTERRLDGAGLQQKMADALDLQFQLAVMNHDAPNWRNSDVSIDTLRGAPSTRRNTGARAGGAAPDNSSNKAPAEDRSAAQRQTDALLDTLSGRGILGRLSSIMTRFMGATPTTRELSRLMMIETLSRADAIFEAQAERFGALLETILQRRNEVVLEDLARVINDERGVRTIGVIYGAGHLPGIEKGLVEDLGYEPVATRWIPAITADLTSTGLSPREARIMRRGLRSMIEMQTRGANTDD